ncbi:MAG: hypothetical protein WBL92_06035 [Methanothrix sp.]
MSINFLKNIGVELVETGKSIDKVIQTIEITNKVLLDMAEAMGTLITALHETDQLLQSAGNNINTVEIPRVDFDYTNVAGIKVISKISLDSQYAFGPTGNDLVKSGQLLHKSELQLTILKNHIHDLSKPKGPLDNLINPILHPLASRLKDLGNILRK